MGYEKELAELRKDWKSSTDKYEEAIEDGYDVDADMWSHDVMEIERQIHVYEQAAKADEYEAKAKAYDTLKNNLEKEVEILIDKVSGFPYVDAPIENTISHFEHVLEMMKNYESGELE